MFKGLGTWLGLENPTYTKTSDDPEQLSVEQEEKVVEAQNEVNKQQPADQAAEPEAKEDNSELGKGLGGEKELFFFTNNCLLCQKLFVKKWLYIMASVSWVISKLASQWLEGDVSHAVC